MTPSETATAINRKKVLQQELEELERQEQKAAEENAKERNFERFMQRPAEYLVGRAHADMQFSNKSYHSDLLAPLLPISVSVSGNCGHSYHGEVPLTDSSKTYFHNVWTDRQHRGFEQRLLAFVAKEIKHITSDLTFTLEIMGLQADHYFVSEKFFPKEKLGLVNKELDKARAEILDRFKDKDFLALLRKSHWVDMETGESQTNLHMDLSHSNGILRTYLKEHRPKIFEKLYPAS